jgi:hypothetical protein
MSAACLPRLPRFVFTHLGPSANMLDNINVRAL